ncbi:MAG: GIY-YIG nuclease family protein [Balneolaceae bacterium]|nr:GIY-YIG nuclease family protein [Balneolaceae bacterium]MBO6546063.1 GIY-YIG nuclease family protein [Balneolaceae bacterium]MBO6647459.1 GIY-YIG nuclease family protein [Balneolaceae bacterium]
MWYVYFLKNEEKDWVYTGSTNDLRRRVSQHSRGQVQSTKHYIPLKLESYIAVQTEQKAGELEKYFKTGSGHAFLKKRIL